MYYIAAAVLQNLKEGPKGKTLKKHSDQIITLFDWSSRLALKVII